MCKANFRRWKPIRTATKEDFNELLSKRKGLLKMLNETNEVNERLGLVTLSDLERLKERLELLGDLSENVYLTDALSGYAIASKDRVVIIDGDRIFDDFDKTEKLIRYAKQTDLSDFYNQNVDQIIDFLSDVISQGISSDVIIPWLLRLRDDLYFEVSEKKFDQIMRPVVIKSRQIVHSSDLPEFDKTFTRKIGLESPNSEGQIKLFNWVNSNTDYKGVYAWKIDDGSGCDKNGQNDKVLCRTVIPANRVIYTDDDTVIVLPDFLGELIQVNK